MHYITKLSAQRKLLVKLIINLAALIEGSFPIKKMLEKRTLSASGDIPPLPVEIEVKMKMKMVIMIVILRKIIVILKKIIVIKK